MDLPGNQATWVHGFVLPLMSWVISASRRHHLASTPGLGLPVHQMDPAIMSAPPLYLIAIGRIKGENGLGQSEHPL